MASKLTSSACFPTRGPLFERDTTIYHFESYVEQCNDLNIQLPEGDHSSKITLQLVLPNADTNVIKKLITDNQIQNLQIVSHETIHATRDGEGGSSIEIDPESNKSNKSNPGENVNAEHFIKDIQDTIDRGEAEDRIEVEVQQIMRRNENNQVVQCFEFKVHKWKMVQPFFRFNTVVLLIFLFLCIATAIFVVFYKYVLDREP